MRVFFTYLSVLVTISCYCMTMSAQTDSGNRTENEFKHSLGLGIGGTTGLGIGLEVIFYDRVCLNLMGGYASFNSFRRIGFTGETALFFRF